MLHNMWHTCQLIMIASLDIINNNQFVAIVLGFVMGQALLFISKL